jgi:general secretion pathway protein H
MKRFTQTITCCSAGFTLLELIIVLFLVSLSVGLVSVHFAGTLSTTKIKSEVRKLSATMRYAKSYAHLQGKEQDIYIDIDEKKYWIEGHNKVVDLPEQVNMTVVMMDYEQYEGKWKISFLSGGGIDTSVDAVILGNEKKQFRINIDPVVGSVIVR